MPVPMAAAPIMSPAPSLPPPVYAQPMPQPFMDPAIISLTGPPSVGHAIPVSSGQSTTSSTKPLVYDDDSSDESSVDEVPYSANRNFTPPVKAKKGQKKGREDRQNQTSSKSSRNGNSRKNKFVNYSNSAAESDGWATENATNIKDTEFDFQANLDLFDKASVFNEIRENDSIDPGHRLVAFNKRAPQVTKPHHQEKYGNLEMVIQSDTNWIENENNDDDDDDDSNNRGRVAANGKGNVKGSGNASSSGVSPGFPSSIPRHIQRGMSNMSISDTPSSSSIQQLRKASTSAAPNRKSFIAANTLKQCPCASPVQMVQLERICSETFGISHQVMNENAGRGIAQLAIKALGGVSRFNFKNHNSRPLIVILAGCNESGARALVAGRHLANRQVQVVAAVPTGSSTSKSLDEDPTASIMAASIKAFESTGGKVVSRLDQLTPLINSFESPVELIIDGLQGYQSSFEDMWEEEAVTTALSLIEWANRHKASVMSLDIPSGLDSSTGLPTNDSQFIKSKWVISHGFPLTGTLNANLAEIVSPEEWTCYIVDVGFPKAALRAAGMRRFEKLWFGSEWSVELTLIDN
ncbi:Edc3p [Sugiyamaella lignohabitans]|uniref:Enhancer of mRNA-decapping protein 3 n=1 Tax=Sugiyamaella lignohabitans TaxID=796027 RepID=A0A167FGS8_9ASCO|nr:Edc3p [Sugiyamaella lignohabitans]ANB15281.1 Edc3p [Sugiyamaella lignohabitans]